MGRQLGRNYQDSAGCILGRYFQETLLRSLKYAAGSLLLISAFSAPISPSELGSASATKSTVIPVEMRPNSGLKHAPSQRVDY